jgi:hypothetical protein
MRKGEYFLLGLFSGGLVAIISLIVGSICSPTAMDVYRGKTTLEITYKDGVPVDSVVVFKD